MNLRTVGTILAFFLAACGVAEEEPESIIIIEVDETHEPETSGVEPETPAVEESSDECVDTLRPEIEAAIDERRVDSGSEFELGAELALTARGAPSPEWTVLHEGVPSSVVETEELVLELSEVGHYDVQLTATKEACQTTEFFAFTVAVPDLVDSPGVAVELLWDTPGDPDRTDTVTGDLDLHYRHEDGEWHERPLDCFSENKGPDWGPEGRVGNPRLSASVVSPESVTHPAPEAAFYDVGVHYVDDRGYGESVATVRIWFEGALVHEATKTLQPGEFWTSATIWGATGSVTEPSSSASDF